MTDGKREKSRTFVEVGPWLLLAPLKEVNSKERDGLVLFRGTMWLPPGLAKGNAFCQKK